jgi:dynein heavy chain
VEYKQSGPGANDVDLDEGLEQLLRYRELVAEFNRRKDELVMAEKLFNLEISTFKELVAIDEENKRLGALYETYKEFKHD